TVPLTLLGADGAEKPHLHLLQSASSRYREEAGDLCAVRLGGEDDGGSATEGAQKSPGAGLSVWRGDVSEGGERKLACDSRCAAHGDAVERAQLRSANEVSGGRFSLIKRKNSLGRSARSKTNSSSRAPTKEPPRIFSPELRPRSKVSFESFTSVPRCDGG